MAVALTREQTVPEYSASTLEGPSFRKPSMVRDEDVFDILWIAQKAGMEPAEPEVCHVPVLCCGVPEKCERIALHSPEAADKRAPLRPGRQGPGTHRLLGALGTPRRHPSAAAALGTPRRSPRHVDPVVDLPHSPTVQQARTGCRPTSAGRSRHPVCCLRRVRSRAEDGKCCRQCCVVDTSVRTSGSTGSARR